MLFILMNKDTELMHFMCEMVGFRYNFVILSGRLPDLYHDISLRDFLETRRPAKHRTEIARLLRNMKMSYLTDFISVSYGLTVTDTLWLKPIDSKLTWQDVSLYRNSFNTVISRYAFTGVSNQLIARSTSPEFGTDGMLPKCWVRLEDDIYLLKRGYSGYWNPENECFSEYFASQLLDALGFNHISYDLVMFHDKLASKCKLYTNEFVSMFPAAYEMQDCVTLSDYLSVADSLDCLEDFKKLLLFDALVYNYDRHLSNIQFLYDADKLVIKGLAPIFDNGASLGSRCTHDDFDSIKQYCKSKRPVIYEDFDTYLPQLISDDVYDKLLSVSDFQFENRGIRRMNSVRFASLNRLIRERIQEVLHLARPDKSI